MASEEYHAHRQQVEALMKKEPTLTRADAEHFLHLQDLNRAVAQDPDDTPLRDHRDATIDLYMRRLGPTPRRRTRRTHDP